MKYLKKLDKSHFGNTILSTIAIHLSTESPIEDVSTLLSEIRQQLQDDQTAEDLQNSTNQAICDKNIQEFQNNIDLLSQTLSSNEQLLSDTQELLIKANDNYEQTLTDLASNNERYSQGETSRLQENSDYLTKMQDHEAALEAVAEAQQLVQSLRNGALFIQLRNKFNKITTKLKEHKTKHFLYQPIIKSLTELASRADQETVNKILALLQSLADALNESKTSEENTEEKRKADWEQLSQDLLEERQTLTQKKQGIEENIDSYSNIIRDTENKINQYTSELENNKKMLQGQEAWCEETRNNYLSNTDERYYIYIYF